MTLIQLLAGILLAGSVAAAQDIAVYSEFRRIDPFGEIVPQDRGGQPREILSPLMARNAYYTLRVVLEAPPGEHYYLHVGSNPEKLFRIKVYKEMWTQQDGVWTPDRLLPVETPYLSHIPDRYHGIPHQKVETFLMDVFVPADLEPGRYKLEPQISCAGRWAVYPMEVRISDIVAPTTPLRSGWLPSTTLPSDASLLGPLREYLCGRLERRGNGPDSIRRFIRRNMVQDIALARQREAEFGKEELANHLLRGLNMSRAEFCAARDLNSKDGPEWYLRGRDFLYRGARKWY